MPLRPEEIDTGRPHPARVYDYLLGGNTHFAADRDVAHQILEAMPGAPAMVSANRAFMRRTTRWLAEQAGIRQFLDIGSGIPTPPNLHEVAQNIAPQARVVYVDNDPIVLAHSAAFLRSTAEGLTKYIEADLTAPADIRRDVLDPDQPIALSLNAVLQFLPDEVAYPTVARLRQTLASGSYLVITHLTADFAPQAVSTLQEHYSQGVTSLIPRSRDQILRFFEDAELVEPGLVPLARWRPPPAVEAVSADGQINGYGAVARL
ncbi:SAM-dependent methyltransferase [Streptomyces venezuelae]|uniref:SAM-dependent methyltransferase n=1 Tax=Streptomyces venezuelae TaxID=54571 RepID=UPI0034407FA9